MIISLHNPLVLHIPCLKTFHMNCIERHIHVGALGALCYGLNWPGW